MIPAPTVDDIPEKGNRTKRALPLALALPALAAVKPLAAASFPALAAAIPSVPAFLGGAAALAKPALIGATSILGGIVSTKAFDALFSDKKIWTRLDSVTDQLHLQQATNKRLNATLADFLVMAEHTADQHAAQTMVASCHAHLNLARIVQNNALDLMDITHTKRVTSAVFGTQSLTRQLEAHRQKAQARGFQLLPTSAYDLTNLPVSFSISSEDAKVRFAVHVPVHRHVYTLHQYLPLPVSHPKYRHRVTFAPQYSYLAASDNGASLYPVASVTDCFLLHSLLYCPSANVLAKASQSSCLAALFHHNREDILQSCPVREAPENTVFTTRLAPYRFHVFSPRPLAGIFQCHANGSDTSSQSYVVQGNTEVGITPDCSFHSAAFSIHPQSLNLHTQVTRRRFLTQAFLGDVFSLPLPSTQASRFSELLHQLSTNLTVHDDIAHPNSPSRRWFIAAAVAIAVTILGLVGIGLFASTNAIHIRRAKSLLLNALYDHTPVGIRDRNGRPKLLFRPHRNGRNAIQLDTMSPAQGGGQQ